MIEIVILQAGDALPDDERYLLLEWRASGSGVQIIEEPNGLRYSIGPDRHGFWRKEAPFLAKRLKHSRIFYLGVPLANPPVLGLASIKHQARTHK